MSDLPVVSDAGPLMVLAKLHLLHLLHELYGQIYIPSSVYDEAVTMGLRQGYEDARTLYDHCQQMNWHPESVPVSSIPPELEAVGLDSGERDTLALALGLGNAQVLMDEHVGRMVARALGLKVRGSLAVLVDAYRGRLIGSSALRAYCTELAERQDIWINPSLVRQVLDRVLEE